MAGASSVADAQTHDDRVIRQVLADMDYIARQVGPTQATPIGKKPLTQAEEDELWDFMDPKLAPQVPELVNAITLAGEQMAAQGQPPEKVEQFVLSQTLKLAYQVFPKREKLIKTGRPTLTEQAEYAKRMALRADRRQAGESDPPSMTEAPPPDQLAATDAMEAPPMSGASAL